MENQQSPAQPPKDFLETYASKLPDGPEKMYLIGRLKDQIDWYDKKSVLNKATYRNRKIRIIIISALIPVAVGYADSTFALFTLSKWNMTITLGQVIKLLVALAGAFVAIWEAISMFMKYRELWFGYRNTTEQMRREAWRYVTKVGSYQDDATRFINLVFNIEGILEQENKQWNSLVKQEDEKEKAQAIRDEVYKAIEDRDARIKAKKEGGVAVTPPPATPPVTTAAETSTETATSGEQTSTPPADTATPSTETAAETPPADTESHGEEEEDERHNEEEESESHGEEEETPKG